MWEYPPPSPGVKWHMFSIVNDFFSSQQRYYHARRPRGSQSGRKRPGTKVCEYGQKSSWVRTLTELFPKIQADACSWLGTKNALYYCAQWANSFFWVLLVSSYTTAIFSPLLPCLFTKLVRARETFIFYFPNRNEGTTDESKKTFGMLSAQRGAIQFAPRIFCFWRR